MDEALNDTTTEPQTRAPAPNLACTTAAPQGWATCLAVSINADAMSQSRHRCASRRASSSFTTPRKVHPKYVSGACAPRNEWLRFHPWRSNTAYRRASAVVRPGSGNNLGFRNACCAFTVLIVTAAWDAHLPTLRYSQEAGRSLCRGTVD